MTSHVGRLYALALALFIFFLTWATVGAAPWAEPRPANDPRVAALKLREQRLRRESAAVQKLVQHRWAVYRVELRKRRSQIAAARQTQAAAAAAAASAPAVRVVNLPPLTVTRTS